MNNKENEATEKINKALLAIIAEYQRRAASERVIRSLENRAMAGYATQRPPLGYSKTSKPGLFAINSKGKAMAELLNKYADGKISSTELHNSLSTVFSPLPKGIRTKYKLCDYISNPYYSGYVSYKNKNYKGKHQALLSEEKLSQVVLKLYSEVRMDFPLAGSNHQG